MSRVSVVLELLAQEGLKDPRGRAGQHQEGEAERRWDRLLQSSGEHVTDASTIRAAQEFGADEKHGGDEDGNERPERANPDLRAVVAQAGGGHHKDTLKLGRQLEELDPVCVVLQPFGR
eukprot:4140566-Prymnesium_polylepis.1